MRGVVDGLVSPLPLLQRLPGVLQDDEFLQRFLPALDDSLAPVVATLDSLAAYVDPWLAPVDFLDWLAGWVDVEIDDEWPEEQRRTVVAAAAQVHRRAGTVSGIRDALRLAFDADVEVEESGAATWSATPGGAPSGAPRPWLRVTLRVEDPEALDVRRVEALLRAVRPAHVPHEFVIEARAAAATRPEPGGQQ